MVIRHNFTLCSHISKRGYTQWCHQQSWNLNPWPSDRSDNSLTTFTILIYFLILLCTTPGDAFQCHQIQDCLLMNSKHNLKLRPLWSCLSIVVLQKSGRYNAQRQYRISFASSRLIQSRFAFLAYLSAWRAVVSLQRRVTGVPGSVCRWAKRKRPFG